MKNLITLLVLSLCFNHVIYSQDKKSQTPDSIEFRMENHLSIKMISSNFFELKNNEHFDDAFSIFLSDLNKVKDQLQFENQANTIVYFPNSEYRKLQISTKGDGRNEISIDREGNTIYFQEVIFDYANGDKIYFKSGADDKFDAFTNVSIKELIIHADTILSPKGRKHRKTVSALFYVENGRIVIDDAACYFTTSDMIELGAYIGLGTVKSTLVPDVGIALTTKLKKKGLNYLHGGFSYDALFFFEKDTEGKEEIKIDGILNAEFGVKNYGVKIGVLLDQNSAAFKNDTYRFGMYRDWKVTVESGLYFSDYLREIYPYFRISKTW